MGVPKMASTKESSRKYRELHRECMGWELRLGLNEDPRNSRVTRLCQRPQRVPGVAPACEDDRKPSNGHVNDDAHVRARKIAEVTLPRVLWLERGTN